MARSVAGYTAGSAAGAAAQNGGAPHLAGFGEERIFGASKASAAPHGTHTAYRAGGLQAALDDAKANAGGAGAFDATSAPPSAAHTSTPATPASNARATPFLSKAPLEGAVSAFGRPVVGAKAPAAALTALPPSAVASAAALLPARAATRAAARAHAAAVQTPYDSYDEAPGAAPGAMPGAAPGAALGATFGAALGATPGAVPGAAPGSAPLNDVYGKRIAVPLAAVGAAPPSGVLPFETAVKTLPARGASGAPQPIASASAAAAATTVARAAPKYDAYGAPTAGVRTSAKSTALAMTPAFATTTATATDRDKVILARGGSSISDFRALGIQGAPPLSSNRGAAAVVPTVPHSSHAAAASSLASTSFRSIDSAGGSGSLRGSGGAPLAAAPGLKTASTSFRSVGSAGASSLLGDLDDSSGLLSAHNFLFLAHNFLFLANNHISCCPMATRPRRSR